MKRLLIFIFFLQILGCKTKDIQQQQNLKPNFLFILVDDLGIKDLGYLGSNYYETPIIDSLAKISFTFSQGYSGSAVCSPSRATILTGQFTARHGITDWIGAKTNENWRTHNRHDVLLPSSNLEHLPFEQKTIAEVLKQNDYETFYIGKWHLGGNESLPTNHGFDINIGGWDAGSPVGGYFSPFKNPYLENKKDGENLTLRLANETSKIIKEPRQKPFFAFLSFYAVHGPIQTTKEKWEKYNSKAERLGILEKGFVMEKKLPIRQTQDNPIYAGLVETLDDAIGIVMKALKEKNLDKNTIVIFTSDNGGVASGDSYSTSNLPYKGGKGYQYEGGTRVPYFIYIPWLATKQKNINDPVTAADFYPTILDYAKISQIKKQHVDGVSLKPMIEKNKQIPERPLFWHYPHYGNQGGDPNSIIRKGKWKLIHYYENNSNELYNLELDPYENTNIADRNMEITKKLEKELFAWLFNVNAKFPTKDTLFNAEKRKIYQENIINQKLPMLEKERLEMFNKNFSPNKTWWGSNVN